MNGLLQMCIPDMTLSVPPRHSNPFILSSFLNQSPFILTLNNVTERGHNIQKWDIINWSMITCVCDSKYFKKNPRRNDLPFLKDPAIDIIKTGYALTSGWNMIFSKFSIFSSNPWEFLPSLTSCVIRIICRGSPLSVIVIILLTVITVGVIKVRNKGKGIDCY